MNTLAIGLCAVLFVVFGSLVVDHELKTHVHQNVIDTTCVKLLDMQDAVSGQNRNPADFCMNSI